MYENGLIRKPKSISNLIRKLRLTMTSQSGQQVITIHICLNILRSIGHQALKFCQLKKKFCQIIQKRRKVGKLQTTFFVYQKLNLRQKQVFSVLVIIYFCRPLLEHVIETNFVTFLNVEPEI